MTACLACLEPLTAEADVGVGYHRACLEQLFGAAIVPSLDIEVARLHTAALAMVGRVSLSGAQQKLSVGLSADRTTLRVNLEGLQFILKPPSTAFPNLPENEHLTMRLAAAAGIEAPPVALMALADGALAYLVPRFDRPQPGVKRHQEDFCQLAQKPPKDKYDGSAELCARLVKRYATEPLVEQRRLFRQLVFAWLTGNGDLHLKNLSLIEDDAGRWALSPAYDLVCTELLIPDDRLALPVGGRDKAITRRGWLDLGAYAGLPKRAAGRVLAELVESEPAMQATIERSLLAPEARGRYAELLRERVATLG